MRKLVMALAGSALLVIETLSVTGTAYAAPGDAQWNSIKGTAKSDGMPASEDRKNPRRKTDSSDGRVILDLKDTVDGRLCVVLYDSKNHNWLSDLVCWGDRERGQKVLTNTMHADTNFFVIATKGGGSDNNWGGSIYY